LKLSTTPWVTWAVGQLAKTERFGKTGTEVAEELLRAKLREIEMEGWLDKRSPHGRSKRK
jgi:hypothetical protein